MSRRVLLTGATGFVGREVLVRLLKNGESVLVITRPRGSTETLDDARARLLDIVDRTDASADPRALRVGFGDVTEPGLGLCPADHEWLRGDTPVHIVHGAAQVRFDLPYAELQRQNVDGTGHVLDLAQELHQRGLLLRLDYVSTAFIAGDRETLALEGEIDVGQTHRNGYERSKMNAELEVARRRQSGLPVTVVRPSIVVGDSRTGRASSFKVLYWPMKLYARGQWRTCFGRRTTTVDVVPVDYVADAIVHLIDRPEAAGQTLHLAAGAGRQATIEALVTIAERFFGGKKVRYFDPYIYHRYLRWFVRPLLTLVKPEVGRSGGVFLPYLIHNPSFSVETADALLGSAGIRPPDVAEYFEVILRYARDTDFGRRPR